MMDHSSGAAHAQQLLLSSAALAAELRTLAGAGSGFNGHNRSAAPSSMLPRSSASASPRCGGGASASPSPLEEEAFSASWGLTPMAADMAAMSSPLAETERVSLLEFIPTLALINAHTPLVGLSSFAQGSGQAQAQAAAAATAAVLMDESEDDAAECASTLPRALIGGGGCASVSTGAAGSSGVLPGISGGPCDVKRISAATMVRLLAGDFQGELDNFIVIDCRYDYEYTGGHSESTLRSAD